MPSAFDTDGIFAFMRYSFYGKTRAVFVIRAAEPFQLLRRQISHVFVDAQTVVCDLDDAARDIGAVIRNTLHVRQKVGEDEPELDRTLPVLHTADMSGAHFILQIVDHFFQRFHARRRFQIVFLKRPQRKIHALQHRVRHFAKVGVRLRRERERFFLHFFDGRDHADRMIGQALEIADDMQKPGRLAAVVLRHVATVDFDKIGPDHIFVMIDLIFLFPNRLARFGVVSLDLLHCALQRGGADVRHRHGDVVAARDRNRRRGQQAFVQKFRMILRFRIRNRQARKAFQLLGEREKQPRTGEIER